MVKDPFPVSMKSSADQAECCIITKDLKHTKKIILMYWQIYTSVREVKSIQAPANTQSPPKDFSFSETRQLFWLNFVIMIYNLI